jgi:predicted AAA+ superfamily ATPase
MATGFVIFIINMPTGLVIIMTLPYTRFQDREAGMDTSVFSIRNPWRSGLLPKEPDRIPRHELQTALSWMDSRHVITIVGPRQAGKSTLMNMLIRHLLSSTVPAANIFYFTTDDAETVTLLANIGDLLALLRGNSTGNGRLYLFIDEIQRLESPGLFLKTLYDLDLDLKIVASGSSSLEIRSASKEPLVGRGRELVLYPLSFGDIAASRIPGLQASSADLAQIQRLYGTDLVRTFEECAVWGTYPAVVTAPTMAQRHDELQQLYQSYVLRDVSQFFHIQHVGVFNNLTTLLARSVGSQVQWETLARTTKSSAQTIHSYVDLLEGTFVCRQVLPYTGNVVGSIRRMPKIYFIDCGLRNSVLSDFSALPSRSDRGHLVEQVVFQELCKTLEPTDRLYYWHMYAGSHEVKFVVVRGESLVPIEINDSSMRSPEVPDGISDFCEAFTPGGAIVMNRDFAGEAMSGTTTVTFLPTATTLARPDLFRELLTKALH